MTVDPAIAAAWIRVAGRALARSGLVHAYGHCSVRLDTGTIMVSPAKPLGLVAAGEECSIVALEGPLPDHILGEVRIHREIYRRRVDVNGVVRSMPPNVMSLGTLARTARARHGFGSYFYPAPPLWNDPQLLRSDEQAAALAEQLGSAPGIAMRGNGFVAVGQSLAQAVVLTWYAEDAARVELDCLKALPEEHHRLLTREEALQRASWSGRILERMWDYLSAGDPELTTLDAPASKTHPGVTS
ncbi:class II aldolase/adducin family protein [Rhizobium rhizogenes]|uniref:Decarboxylase protein n=1 Tax=Rhizobium rhizogenes (strain K84 / ATCC BAA-868) TaxID=311403 RepID=B9JMM8_RHIR8|nr:MULTISPECIES: class II aldolase/adducin family protein [Rhizobium]ACM28809.1 decarboxylase protein [Rhizobium rhizogenes K84]OCJ18930.1 aldolase [Agrobacterium sp. B131/95]EJK88106.1 ribulose-5-phosphate 4-epimerase-like epimerase or aldolase [Rhizobium sp. AP16]NTI24481.1 class II aldolase/adducin family protein [Rhizobium rhizogenes]NTI43801.1 class II aldolase/adducin family protein [Rhizobium rhizogenes]